MFLCGVGGWGNGCNDGGNPGCYLDTNFDSCFGSKLVVGDGITITLTTSGAVQNFLPSGGTSDVLFQDYTDPNDVVLGNLAGQMTALTLNVGFDACNDTFASPESLLGDQVYGDTGSCSGMTVAEILTLGNQALGGTITMPYTFPRTLSVFTSLSMLNACVTNINENYVDGNTDGGNLRSPGCSESAATPAAIDSPSSGPSSGPTASPNSSPSSGPSNGAGVATIRPYPEYIADVSDTPSESPSESPSQSPSQSPIETPGVADPGDRSEYTDSPIGGTNNFNVAVRPFSGSINFCDLQFRTQTMGKYVDMQSGLGFLLTLI
jgi:hypothetical protein